MNYLQRAAFLSWLMAPSLYMACGDGDSRPATKDSGAEPIEDERSADAHADGEAGTADAGLDAGDGMKTVSVRFKAKLGAEDLACGRVYEGQGKNQIKATPKDFRFYVQEVRLVHKGSQQEERLIFDVKAPFQRAEVALIDFTDATGTCGGNGGSVVNTTITGKVPAGDYDGIVFVNGVPEELNHAGPAETAGAPLDDVTLFWSWLNGYRFIIAELMPLGLMLDAGAPDGSVQVAVDAGLGDASALEAGTSDGAAHAASSADAASGGHGGAGDAGMQGGGHNAVSGAAMLHIGSTGCSGGPAAGFSCSRQARNEIRLANFDAARNFVVADLAAVFKDSDLAMPPQCHGVDTPCAAPYAAFGVDMNTGSATSAQQVFRVE